MAITRTITRLDISWQDAGSGIEPNVSVDAAVIDDIENTVGDANFLFIRSELSPNAQAKLDVFLADVLGNTRARLGAGRPINTPS